MPAKPPIPVNEDSRLAALERYRILDTAPEKPYDDITQLASFICGTPIAWVSLVGADRQWFKARLGIDLDETPREHAFCAYTVNGRSVMEVEDATKDERFAENPLVLGEPHVRFYAGAPLLTAGGEALGSLCVVDRHPRKLSGDQKNSLESLARLVMNNLEFRRVAGELAEAASRINVLHGMLPICAGCKQIRDDQGYWQQVERYISTHSEATFSHTYCPKCAKKYFPDVDLEES